VKYTLRAADPDAARELGRSAQIAPMVAQVLLQRGIGQPDLARAFTQPKLASLSAPDAMADRALAADRLASAIRRRERIAVFGDYDVDGTTSAAILSDTLQALGADVTAFVANRFEGGYGFNDHALTRVLTAKPAVIVTCDCGSSDHERIARARAAGVDVLVVDHHLVPTEPLPALAFLNPHRPECGFAYKGLASAGLVFSLAAAVRGALGKTLDLRPWLDLVALGTIADVAPLDGDNRALVRAGLMRIAEGQARPGIAALCQIAGRQAQRMGAIDVAFRLTPRLNAAGRMGDPTLTLDLLRANDADHAKELAMRIDGINEQRKAVEREVTAAAVAQVRAHYGERLPAVIVAAGEGWHRGVVGITAARLSETFGVSAIAIAFEGDIGHGSARARDGFALYDAIERCRPLLRAFGGHQAASGLSLHRDQLDALREALAEHTMPIAADVHDAESTIDVAIDGNVMPLPTASELWALEPLGERNPEPRVLLQQAVVERARTVGEGHLKLTLRVGRQVVSAFGYELASQMPAPGQRVNAIGMLRPDHWAGENQVELRMTALETMA
jgi:single-stranded-DNA-specific exonuclease